ncbi:chalcone isomerase family protein [Orrella marina]|uniref:Chalcone isomerase domain-containing protein n=1 Tax=Orrella marina TaxID=2163011 RepID=A0A2R4XGC6_9BURK|nr:chalcone isomerase family protein [Orrella marina]AWB32870.1 hypothetical protein DBV39_03095 [Orrella marina]
MQRHSSVQGQPEVSGVREQNTLVSAIATAILEKANDGFLRCVSSLALIAPNLKKVLGAAVLASLAGLAMPASGSQLANQDRANGVSGHDRASGGDPVAGDALSQTPAFGWHALVPHARRVGQGQFRRFGFLIYDATLLAPNGRYQPDEPFALELRYARTISRDQIIDASLDQMQALGVDVDQHPDWKAQLHGALMDVRAGDVLTGVYVPGRGSGIFHEGVRLGRLDDALAQAFFAIWLDHRTSDPDLRAELLGQSD